MHNSLVDLTTQTDIILHPSFIPWINHTDSIRTTDKIFADAVTREWKKKMEPLREVNAQWLEQTEDSQIQWKPDLSDQYMGPNSSALKSGSSGKMKQVVRNTTYFANAFLGVLLWRSWMKCAGVSKVYAYK